MFCKKCGKQIDADSDFCKHCGAKLNYKTSRHPRNLNIMSNIKSSFLNHHLQVLLILLIFDCICIGIYFFELNACDINGYGTNTKSDIEKETSFRSFYPTSGISFKNADIFVTYHDRIANDYQNVIMPYIQGVFYKADYYVNKFGGKTFYPGQEINFNQIKVDLFVQRPGHDESIMPAKFYVHYTINLQVIYLIITINCIVVLYIVLYGLICNFRKMHH